MSNLPRVGQQLEIRSALLIEPLLTYVNYAGPDGVVVQLPKDREHIELAEGEIVQVQYPLGDNGAVAFSTKVLSVSLDQYPPIAKLLAPQPVSLQPQQRRDYVRVDTNLPVTYKRLNGDGKVEATAHESRTYDLSGNGAMILVPSPYPAGTRMLVAFQLPNKRQISCRAEVVRVMQPDVPLRKGGVWAGLRFTEIMETDRKAIMKYIFDVQRERLRMGIGKE